MTTNNITFLGISKDKPTYWNHECFAEVCERYTIFLRSEKEHLIITGSIQCKKRSVQGSKIVLIDDQGVHVQLNMTAILRPLRSSCLLTCFNDVKPSIHFTFLRYFRWMKNHRTHKLLISLGKYWKEFFQRKKYERQLKVT